MISLFSQQRQILLAVQNIALTQTHYPKRFKLQFKSVNTGTCYLESQQIAVLLVAVQDDVVGHAETLSHSEVVEKGRLAERVTHLHHSYI